MITFATETLMYSLIKILIIPDLKQNPLMKIGILTAMESEHNQIAALLTDKNTVNDQFTYVVGKLDDKEIILRQCGIGKVNAAVGTAELLPQCNGCGS